MDSINKESMKPRVIAYFDIDCFYAQAETLRLPHLQNRPVGVTQKSLVVTCNYAARELGVPKTASIQEAKRRCPDIVLINGEDLTPYRSASKNIMAVLGRFGVLERRGLDEFALDISMEVHNRSSCSACYNDFSGIVLGLQGNDTDVSQTSNTHPEVPSRSDYYIVVGSHVVQEIRSAVLKETGFTCSAGIATNKMLAKLATSVNKPNKQTCMLDCAVSEFLQPLPVRKIPGVGNQTESVLKSMGVTTVADLQQISLQQMLSKFGKRVGMLLYENCRGLDTSPVQDKGPPKSLSVEDSFPKPCTSFEQAEDIIRSLAPDLISRLDEDKEEYSRKAKSFTIKWRYPGIWAFKSASAQMPLELYSENAPLEKRIETVVAIAVKLLIRALEGQTFAIAVLNIGATNFTFSSHDTVSSKDIRSFLTGSRDIKPSLHHSPVDLTKQLPLARKHVEEYRILSLDRKMIRPLNENLASYNVNDGDQQADYDSLLEMEGEISEEDIRVDIAMRCYNDIFGQDGVGEHLLGDSSHCAFSTSESTAPTHYNDIVSGHLLKDRNHGACSLLENTQDDIFPNEVEGLNQSIDVNSEVEPSLLLEKHKYSLDGISSDQMDEYTCDIQCGGMVSCGKCGEKINGDYQSIQEHEDYHLALELNSQEQRLSTSLFDNRSLSSSLSSSSSLAVEGNIKGNKNVMSNQQPAKRKKIQRTTLDSFLYRS